MSGSRGGGGGPQQTRMTSGSVAQCVRIDELGLDQGQGHIRENHGQAGLSVRPGRKQLEPHLFATIFSDSPNA